MLGNIVLVLWYFIARFKKIIISCYNAFLQDLNKHVTLLNNL